MASASAFGDAFLDGRGHAFDEVLGFLQAETGDLADDLDDADLVGAEARHGHGELGLLFGGRGRSRAGTAAGRGHRDRGRGRDAELVFHHLHEIDDFHDGHVGDRVQDVFFASSHCRHSEICLSESISKALRASARRRLLLVLDRGDGPHQLRVGLGQRAHELARSAP